MEGNDYTLVFCGERTVDTIPLWPNRLLREGVDEFLEPELSEEEEMKASSALNTIRLQRHASKEAEAEAVSPDVPSRETLYWTVFGVGGTPKLFRLVYFWVADGEPHPSIPEVRVRFKEYSAKVLTGVLRSSQ